MLHPVNRTTIKSKQKAEQLSQERRRRSERRGRDRDDGRRRGIVVSIISPPNQTARRTDKKMKNNIIWPREGILYLIFFHFTGFSEGMH